jgi:succinate dehydrogenase / fumarate reductase flavoprotein subunit
MAEELETIEHDVLVVGAGGAGLRAAIAAADAGLDTGLTTKSLLGKAHTVMAEGGIAAALGNVDKEDGWETHFYDTMKSAQFINNWRMAEIFCKEAIDRVYELEEWGALFDRTEDGLILQRPFGAHSWRRLCHVGDRTGLELIRTCQDRVVASEVDVHQEVTITRLLKDGERIAGAFAYRRDKGSFLLFKAKAVVIATGGWGRVYRTTSNSWESTGDGITMGFEAGAELQDMEMVQFHPTGMVWPPGVKGLLVTEAVRGEGGTLTNSKGERFMKVYDPKKMELSSRDVVARAIYAEVQAGRGTEHGGVYLDITHKGAEYVRKKLPSMYKQFMALADIDITREKMEVGPTVHYVMGGLRVDPETGATNVPGLFAGGEVAAGLHGANRLGGNSLSDILVFGRRAGLGAAEYAKGLGAEPRVEMKQADDEQKRLLAPLQSKAWENPYKLVEEMQDTMARYVGIQRNEADLQEALRRVLALKERAMKVGVPGDRIFNPGWNAAIDLPGMLLITEVIVRSAIERKESRGAHSRTDFPKKDDEWGRCNLVAQKNGDGVVFRRAPVPLIPGRFIQIIEEKNAKHKLVDGTPWTVVAER